MLAAPLTLPPPVTVPPPVVPSGLGGTGQPTAYATPYGAMHIGNTDMPGIGPRNRLNDLTPPAVGGRRGRRAGSARMPEVYSRPAPRTGSFTPFVAQFLIQAVMGTSGASTDRIEATESYRERNLSDQLPPSRGPHRRAA